MARQASKFEYGISDDDEEPSRGPQREESMADFLADKDPTMKLAAGGAGRGGRSSYSGFKDFDMSGSGDPLDALKAHTTRRNSAPAATREPEMDEEERLFQLEFMREAGLLAGGGDETDRSGNRAQSPAPAPSPGERSADESLDDIVGDILDERPVPKSPPRRTAAPSSSVGENATSAAGQTSAPGSRRGSFRGDESGRGDESPPPASRSGRPPRALSRPPPEDGPTPRGEDYSTLGGGYEPDMARGFAREGSLAPSMHSDREGSVVSDRGSRTNLDSMHLGDDNTRVDASMNSLGGRGGRRKLAAPPDPVGDILGDDSAGPRSAPWRSASPAMGSGAESRGSTTPTGRGGTDAGDSSHLYAPKPEVGSSFNVELTVKPKRKLGMAKASPAPSASRTPPLDEEMHSRAAGTPMSGRVTPPAGQSSTPMQSNDGPMMFGGRSNTPRLPASQDQQQQPPSPAPSLPMGDSDNDDYGDDFDLPGLEVKPPPPPPPPPLPGLEAGQADDIDMPDFLKGAREGRRRRGEPSPIGVPAGGPPRMSPKSAAMGADLGLSAEDMLPSDNSATMLDNRQAGTVEDASGSGSGLMRLEVPLDIKPKGGRRMKAKGGPSALDQDEFGSGSHSAGQSDWPQGSPANQMGNVQLQRGSPAHNPSHSASQSVTPSAAQSGSAHAQSKLPSSVPQASGSEVGSAGQAGYGYAGMPGGPNIGISGTGFQGGAAYHHAAPPLPQGHVISPRHAHMSSAALQGVAVPGHPGIDSAPPSLHGFPAVPGLPMATLPHSLRPADGLPPGSPFTHTAQSESSSLHARHNTGGPPNHHAMPTGLTMPHMGTTPHLGGGSPLPSDARRSNAGGGGGTPGSEPVLSLFGADYMQGDGGRAFGGFSAHPPLSAAPSADLVAKLAYSEAKNRQLELQLEDCDQRWVQRLADAKQQSEAEHERMELQAHRAEADLDRCKETHTADMRHLNEKKQLTMQNSEMEKDNIRRDEKRKAQLDLEKLRADHTQELEALQRRHERSLSIAQQQADMEADNFRKAHTGEHQLGKLIEQVQGSVAEVERMSRRVDTDKSVEWSVRERQLEAREKTVREMEAGLSAQGKEVEEQRRRVSELVRHMEDSQVDDREALKLERARLQDEHARLLALQQSLRDADRNNKEALKHAWAQLEDEKHSFQQERLRMEGELQAHREETELLERQQRQETERLKTLHNQVEVARQNASRRIRETEVTIASERRALMSDLEVFEEKRRVFAADVTTFEEEKRSLTEERGGFEQEVKSVGQMAVEVQRRSEELKALHDQAGEARGDILRLHSQLSEERTAHGSELERLKTMQTLVEQQRLQLLQTENQLRIRGIEDIDLMVTTQATFPADGAGPPYGQAGGNPFEAFGSAMQFAGNEPSPYAAIQDPSAGTKSAVAFALPVSAGSTTWSGRGISGLGNRMPATPGIAGGNSHRAAADGGSRMELQTLLRRTKEASGDVLYIQEQFRFLQQSQPAGPMPRDDRPPSYSANRSAGGAGFGFLNAGQSRLRPGSMPAAVSRGALLAPSHSTSTDDDYASPTLEGMRPLSSDIDGTSGGSG